MTECLLEAKGVTKSYDDGRIQALRAAQSTARPGTKSAPDISEKH